MVVIWFNVKHIGSSVMMLSLQEEQFYIVLCTKYCHFAEVIFLRLWNAHFWELILQTLLQLLKYANIALTIVNYHGTVAKE